MKTFIELKYYIDLQHKYQQQLNLQLKQCNDFLESDMCHRNTVLRELVHNEMLKLEEALNYDIVKGCAGALNSTFKRFFPDENKTDRAVRISQALFVFQIFKDEPFLTIEAAEDHANREGLTSGKKVICDRIKKLVDL